MFKHSFMKGAKTEKEILTFMRETDKPIEYTHGLSYRKPTTHNEPISRGKALSICARESYLDIDEEINRVHINTYSGNDMW